MLKNSSVIYDTSHLNIKCRQLRGGKCKKKSRGGQKERAARGIEPRTTRTQSEYHTTRPRGLQLEVAEDFLIFSACHTLLVKVEKKYIYTNYKFSHGNTTIT